VSEAGGMQNDTQANRETEAGLDLRNLLALDHARLDKLFDSLVAAFDADARSEAARLWSQFELELARHFALEEQEIFPEFAKVAPAEAAELLHEHGALRSRLQSLSVGVDLHLTRAETVSAFVRTLRSHAKREDALLYRWAQTNLSEQTQATLRGSLVHAIQEFLGIARTT
jgi:hemerythrin-like domain-containing protein